jgi:Cys-tRNA(Pro)/Cys-tRNA(Cys) deacylase
MARRKQSPKNNAMRALEANNVPYEVISFAEDIRSAAGVAESTGLPPTQVFKTLVVLRADTTAILALVDGSSELNLKAVALAVGDKKVQMAGHNQAEKITGLKVGGISPLALLNRGFRVFIDRSVLEHTHVYLSAGERGKNVRVSVDDLLRITGAELIDCKQPV